MSANFNTSVNIIRDSNSDLSYIPTPNAKQVAGQLVNDFKIGIRSFNIIGTYGTGKSSFLMALEQSVKGKKRHFNINFSHKGDFEFIKIIGSYTSIIDQFAEQFDTHDLKNHNEEILTSIFERYASISVGEKTLFILIDEFGKFLEYASKNNPEKELYFIQQLAEFCNDSAHRIILITTVHQSLESYAFGLTKAQQQEWAKVKGRFREITFNEPIEQLLYLASEHISSNNLKNANEITVAQSLKLAFDSRAFDFNGEFVKIIADKLFPLDLIAATCLTLSLQRYGQNERSLFSFLESTDHTGLVKFSNLRTPFYNLASVYDYLNYNFYSFLTSKYNPDFATWSSIRNAIDEAERTFPDDINNYLCAIKVIGLLNLYAANGSNLDAKFMGSYLNICCGITKADQVIADLESKLIIRFRKHAKRFILFEGTDLDIQSALLEAGDKISEIADVPGLLTKYIEFNPVFAKQYSFEYGTPRYFEFLISDYPEHKVPTGEIDGYINLVFSSKIAERDIQQVSELEEEAIIYCYFKHAEEIKNLLFEIEKTKRVILENDNDKIAVRELENINTHQLRLLKHLITDSIFRDGADVSWYFKGERISLTGKKDFNILISRACAEVYQSTPIYKNELANRHKISPSIHSAKRNYFKSLATNWDKEDLGFDADKFPPEKTIYLSLLKENGLSLIREREIQPLTIGQSSSFYNLWCISEAFLNQAKKERIKVAELVETLQKRPFKLKQGFIDFWVPTFLFLKREEFAVFNDDGYVPNLSEEILELVAKYPASFAIKTFDIDGVKLDIFNSYRSFLNLSNEEAFNNDSFIETIKPFLVFYKQLPSYSKTTSRLSNTAKRVREAIKNSKDPEETFFLHFPEALGFKVSDLQYDGIKLQAFTVGLQEAVRELRTSYDALIDRFEEFIFVEFIGKPTAFIEYKQLLQKRFAKIKRHFLLANQKSFIQRLDSPLDDRKAWLNSLAQAITGKIMESFVDEDEVRLYEGFKSTILALDGLTAISKVDIDEVNEDIVGIKFDSFFQNTESLIVRYPKSKQQELEKLKSSIKTSLGKDSTMNLAAMIELLKEMLK